MPVLATQALAGGPYMPGMLAAHRHKTRGFQQRTHRYLRWARKSRPALMHGGVFNVPCQFGAAEVGQADVDNQDTAGRLRLVLVRIESGRVFVSFAYYFAESDGFYNLPSIAPMVGFGLPGWPWGSPWVTWRNSDICPNSRLSRSAWLVAEAPSELAGAIPARRRCRPASLGIQRGVDSFV